MTTPERSTSPSAQLPAAGARVSVIGYSTLEHSLIVGTEPSPDRTAIVTGRTTPDGGRVGGCAAIIAAGLARSGTSAGIASWVGQDAGGQELAQALRHDGVDITALEHGGATPATWMIHGTHGRTWCLYDPAGGLDQALTEPQQALVRSSTWCVIAIGPPRASRTALRLLGSDQHLLWAVKADSVSCPPDLVRELAARADVITLSERERAWVDESLGGELAVAARPSCLVVQTHGATGIAWRTAGRSGQVETPTAVDVADTSGAGDTATAGLLSSLIAGAEPDAAVRGAVRAAAEMLTARAASQTATRALSAQPVEPRIRG